MNGPADLVAWWRNSSKNRVIQQFTAAIHAIKESGILTINPCSHDQQFPALVLAAGRASRMGHYKQLLRVPGRGTLLDNAIGQARQLSAQITVVAGAGYPLVRFRCHRQPASWIVCDNWQAGLAESLKAGVAALGPRALGVFVVLGDQPLLDVDGLKQLARQARDNPAKALGASYGHRTGVPAWIPRALWLQVFQLEGDAGAGVILNRAGAGRVDIAGVQQDVDTPGDWRQVRAVLSTEQA